VGGWVWVQKKWVPDRVEEQKNGIRPRSGRNYEGFEVQNAIWEALGEFFCAPSARPATHCFSMM
jgi:hypothetical protein